MSIYPKIGIGVELYADRSKSKWRVGNNGSVETTTEPLDIKKLLSQAGG